MSEANFTVAPGSSPCPTRKARRQHGSARRRSLSLRDLDGGLDFDGDGGNERGYSIPHRGLKPCLRGLGLLCGHLGDELVVDGEDERGLGAGLAPLPQERDCLFDAVGPRPLNWRVEDLGIARLVGEKPPTAAQRRPRRLRPQGGSKLDYSGNMTIAVIGYPGQPVDMTIAEVMQFFRTPVTTSPQFGYKRLSEGFTADDPVTEAGIFRHKANTSGGNSGSPIFDLKDASVVGLHSSGYSRNDSQMGINLALTSERVLASLRASGIAAPQ